MLIELSTEQLGLLDSEGKINIVIDEKVVVIEADKLDIGLDELAMGAPAKTPDGHTVTA